VILIDGSVATAVPLALLFLACQLLPLMLLPVVMQAVALTVVELALHLQALLVYPSLLLFLQMHLSRRSFQLLLVGVELVVALRRQSTLTG
jgi:hypothetical protein